MDGAQAQDFKKKQKWFQGPGKVKTLEGKTLEGHIYYSFQYQIVQVIINEKSVGFKSKDVAYFEYFDEGFEKNRKFYTIPYDRDANGKSEPIFFEVIKELADVALVKTQVYLNFDLMTGNSERLTETLYFADSKGNIKPYVEIVHKLGGAAHRQIDPNGIRFVTKSKYYRVAGYIKDEKLNEKKEEDIVKILEYYEKIR
ncbi:MAG: hypothetical protein RJQ09_12830 [Cyclobacteriaceae bacterium]